MDLDKKMLTCTLIVKQILSFATDNDIYLLKRVNIKFVFRKNKMFVCLYKGKGLIIFISKYSSTIIGKYEILVSKNQRIRKQIASYDDLCSIITNIIRES